MRKLALFTGAMLVLILALAGGLSTPRAAWGICYCETYSDYATPTNWGMAADCTAAHNDLLARTAADARADCGGIASTCLGALVNTSSNPVCFFNGTMFQEDGYRLYSCKVCGPIGP